MVVGLTHREYEGWIRSSPENVDSIAYEEVVEAVEQFEPVDNEAHVGPMAERGGAPRR